MKERDMGKTMNDPERGYLKEGPKNTNYQKYTFLESALFRASLNSALFSINPVLPYCF
jgi:hypothetical protein